MCKVHNLQYQAYCSSDLKLLCIECLIGDHKGHFIQNLPAAKEKFIERIKVATILKVKTSASSEVSSVLKEIKEQEKEIKKIFDEFRSAILEQEIKVQNQLSLIA